MNKATTIIIIAELTNIYTHTRTQATAWSRCLNRVCTITIAVCESTYKVLTVSKKESTRDHSSLHRLPLLHSSRCALKWEARQNLIINVSRIRAYVFYSNGRKLCCKWFTWTLTSFGYVSGMLLSLSCVSESQTNWFLECCKIENNHSLCMVSMLRNLANWKLLALFLILRILCFIFFACNLRYTGNYSLVIWNAMAL